jgi:hypothetical protein
VRPKARPQIEQVADTVVLELIAVGPARLDRPVARQSYAMHQPPKAMVVIDWVVLRRPVVPERDGIRFPPEAAGELRLDLMREQISQQRGAFLLCPAFEASSVGDVDI